MSWLIHYYQCQFDPQNTKIKNPLKADLAVPIPLYWTLNLCRSYKNSITTFREGFSKWINFPIAISKVAFILFLCRLSPCLNDKVARLSQNFSALQNFSDTQNAPSFSFCSGPVLSRLFGWYNTLRVGGCCMGKSIIRWASCGHQLWVEYNEVTTNTTALSSTIFIKTIMRVQKWTKIKTYWLVQDIEKTSTATAIESGLNEMYFSSWWLSLEAKRSMWGLPNLHLHFSQHSFQHFSSGRLFECRGRFHEDSLELQPSVHRIPSFIMQKRNTF